MPVLIEIREIFGRRIAGVCVLATAWTQMARNSASASKLVMPFSIKSGASPSKAAPAILNAIAFCDLPRPEGRERALLLLNGNTPHA